MKTISRAVLFGLVIVSIFSLGSKVHAGEPVAGFIPAPVWLSDSDLVPNTTTKIHTVVYNGTPEQLSFSVVFFDGEILLGRKNVTVQKGASTETNIDWKVIPGDHAIRAHIESTKKENGTSVILGETDTSVYRFTVLTQLTETKITPGKKTSDDTASTNNNDNAATKITKGAESAFSSFDSLRKSGAESMNASIKKAEAVLDEKKSSSETKSTTTTKPPSFERPLTYVKLFFLKTFGFIFSHAILFYGLIALLVLLFIRYLIRAPR